MTVRALVSMAVASLSLIVFGALATGHDWAISSGVLMAVASSFMLAIRTDDPDRTIQEIFENEAQMRRLRRTT